MKHFLHNFSICILVLALQVAKAQPGYNDPTFNPNDVGSNYGVSELGSEVTTILQQSDGKTLVGGNILTKTRNSNPSWKNWGIARLNHDLSFDTTFQSGNGFGNGNYTATVYSLALQSNGKIIVAGNFTTYNNQSAAKIVRLNIDGTIDTTFSSTVTSLVTPKIVIVQPDDKILVGMQYFNSNLPTTLVRLNPNGDLDSSFFMDTSIRGVSELKLLNNGQFYGVALKFITSQNFSYRIIRFNADGSTDSTFQFLTNSNILLINSLDVQSDGKVIVGGGSFLTVPNNPSAKYLVRLNLDGSIDSTFNHSLNNGISKLKVLSTDEILIMGSFSYTNVNGTLTKYFGRLSASGTIDIQFFSEFNNYIPKDFVIENTGSIICSLSPLAIYKKKYFRYALRLDNNGNIDTNLFPSQGSGGEIVCSVTQPDGKIVYAGAMKNYNGWGANFVFRLNVDGTIDTTFQSFQLSVNSFGATNSRMLSLSLQNDGKILIGRISVIAGDFYYMGTAVTNLFRLNTDGTLDNSFVTNLSGIIPQTSSATSIHCHLVLPNNKILVGGNFTTYGTSPSINANGIILLNNDGTRSSLSSTFSANSAVFRLVFDLNGKILAGGGFTIINGAPLNKLARFDTLGVIDTTFHIGSGFNYGPGQIIVLPDDKILVCGGFTTYNGDSIFRIARLHPNGNIDTTFDAGNQFRKIFPGILGVQSDGKIIITGNYPTTTNGLLDSACIKRLNIDGSLDSTFRTINTDGFISTLAIQNNGTAIIGGGFRRYDGYPRNHIARIFLNPCNAPTFTSTTSAHRCDPGVLTLQANASAGTIKWFTVPNGGFSLGTGSSFTTSFLNTTKTYYVEATDSNCTSNRIAVTASILGATVNNQSLTICNGSSVTVGSHIYNSSGVYVDSLTSSLGCDSVVTTTLNVVNNFTSNTTASICNGESYIIAQHTYTSTGVYSDTLTAIGGCDSIVVTNLTVHPNYIINNPQTICAGSSYTFNAHTYSIAGNYNDTLQTVNGCDSIVVTQLTITPLPIALTISAMGNTTFCSGSSVMLMGNNGGTWSNGQNSNDITVNTSGNYYVVKTNSCGSDTSNVITITVNPLPIAPNISAMGNTSFCAGDSATLTGNNGGTWSNGQSTNDITVNTSGNYYVVSSNSCGSDTSNIVSINVNPLPIAPTISAIGSTNLCHGNSLILTGNNGGVWNDGSTASDTLIFNEGSYYVTTTNSCGSTVSNTINVNQISVDTAVTVGNASFLANASNATFQWLLCNGTYSPIPSETNQTFTPTMVSGFYAVEVTQNGCADTSACYPLILTGLPYSSNIETVELYPNPANNQLTVDNGQLKIGTLTIQNTLGEIVFYKQNCNALETIDVSGFASGVYFVRLENKTTKFIKQ